jgi:hypothetical protein
MDHVAAGHEHLRAVRDGIADGFLGGRAADEPAQPALQGVPRPQAAGPGSQAAEGLDLVRANGFEQTLTCGETLIDLLGYDAYDVDPLDESRRSAPGTPAQHTPLDPDGTPDAPGRPVSAADLTTLLPT